MESSVSLFPKCLHVSLMLLAVRNAKKYEINVNDNVSNESKMRTQLNSLQLGKNLA